MKTIWKFPLSLDRKQVLKIPSRGKILRLATQGGIPHIWVFIDSDIEEEERTFITLGTGHQVYSPEAERLQYIGTWEMHQGALIWHVFELLPSEL